jgi:hypothetical protein
LSNRDTTIQAVIYHAPAEGKVGRLLSASLARQWQRYQKRLRRYQKRYSEPAGDSIAGTYGMKPSHRQARAASSHASPGWRQTRILDRPTQQVREA